MCRPPCCNRSGSQGTGIAAVAVLIGAALIAAKIGPIVASIVHTVLEVIRLAALVVALAVITWAAITIARWQLRRNALGTTRTRMVFTRPWEQTKSADRPDCLACGDTGTVLALTGGSRYQPQACPVCEPVQRVG